MSLSEEVVTLGEGLMNLKVQLLVDMDGGLESLKGLTILLVLLVGDSELIPGQHILRPKLLFENAVSTRVSIKCVLEDV